jgi:FtsH-binding integral membrane protein
MINNAGLTVFCLFGSMISLCAVVCCFGKSYPANYILLFVFTFCESYMLGGFTSNFSSHNVITATLGTALVTVALTLYAMTTKTEIEVFLGLIWVLYMAVFPLMIIGLFLGVAFANIVLFSIGVSIYSVFLIVDTKMICDSNKSMGGFDIDYDDHILCALQLYLDIVMIFVYLLRLLGECNQ